LRLLAFFFLAAVPALALPANPPATLRLPGSALLGARRHPDQAILQAARHAADHAMQQPPVSVMDKKQIPPSGDKHDFMSEAPYWWPNPSTPNGLPYVRRDGETNPEEANIPDHANFFRMEDAVRALALGYYLTGDEQYASRAVLLLRTWFLDPATRMNPNLNYGQSIPGITTGRGTGLIGMRDIPAVLDGITLLSQSPALTGADRDGLRAWFRSYMNWLENSPIGRAEAAAKNNHGSWYDQQLAGIALFLGDSDLARNVIETAKTRRIALQIKPDGREPLELARTKSFSYSTFNLTALMRLAQEGEEAGVDLWDYQAPNGGSIRAALDYLLPYAMGEKTWPYQSLNGIESGALVEPLLLAAIHYRSADYLYDAEKLDKHANAEDLLLRQDAQKAVPAATTKQGTEAGK
jgi:hypothetical protein